MYGIFLGTFISLSIFNILIKYFNFMNFFYENIYLYLDNLLEYNLFEIFLLWMSYQLSVNNESVILESIVLTFYHMHDNFQNFSVFWDIIVNFNITQGKRFMLCQNYRNNLVRLCQTIFNLFVIYCINSLIEVLLFIGYFVFAKYLINCVFLFQINDIYSKYSNYLKGITIRLFNKTFSNLYLYISIFVGFFMWFYFLEFFFNRFVFKLFSLIFKIFNSNFYQFLFIYTFFYLSFLCFLKTTKIFYRFILNTKYFTLKIILETILIVSQIIFFVSLNYCFELDSNNNFFQEFFFKIFFILYMIIFEIKFKIICQH